MRTSYSTFKTLIKSDKLYGDYGHIMYTVYYIVKHNLNSEDTNKFLEEEIKRSYKKFYHHGFSTYFTLETPKLKINLSNWGGGDCVSETLNRFKKTVMEIVNAFRSLDHEETVHINQ